MWRHISHRYQRLLAAGLAAVSRQGRLADVCGIRWMPGLDSAARECQVRIDVRGPGKARTRRRGRCNPVPVSRVRRRLGP
jgi:hypothetical protein